MGRKSIADLSKPARTWDITKLAEISRLARPIGGWACADRSKDSGQFETKLQSKCEDKLRVPGLRRAANRGSRVIDANAALALAARLGRPFSRCEPSLASSRYMRRFRIRFIGAVWKLIETGPWRPGQVSKFTALHRSWEFTPETLDQADPQGLLNGLRAQLKRLGAGAATGPLIACIHGEFEPESRIYRLHVHGIAFGDMIPFVDRLRDLPAFRPRSLVGSPVQVTRKPLSNLPYPLGYICKSYWPSRRIGAVGDDGQMRRQRSHRRIPEPYHSQVLLWLDRWSISDLTLLMNVRVGPDGFVPTKSVHQFQESTT